MKRDDLIRAFCALGKVLEDVSDGKEWQGFRRGVTEDEYNHLIAVVNRQVHHNGWFTKESIHKSFAGIASWLNEKELEAWSSNYSYSSNSCNVAIIMAGNLPLVGFHDLLSVLFSGHKAICKLSSDDKHLLPVLVSMLYTFDPRLEQRIQISLGKLEQFDAVIATGSNNSLTYFEQYFGKYPHIFRKNRTSIAILTGNESDEQLKSLGEDIFTYFGLGCRNVSFLFIPESFEISRFFNNIVSYGTIINHHKYANNYDYNKAVYLLNKIELLDNNFVLLRASDELFSPLSMIHYHRYKNSEEVNTFIANHEQDIQVIVGEGYEPFGRAQQPHLDDYADNVDTMKWLANL